MLAEKWFAYKLFKIGRKISYLGSGYVAFAFRLWKCETNISLIN